jgi:hypothetical protein
MMAEAKTACWTREQPACCFQPVSISATRRVSRTLYFQMSGVRAFFEMVRHRAPVVWPLETMDYGQLEFGIRDVNGYVLAFAERVNEEEPHT